ncbi:hypothetical protein L0664_01965 [Octadecabacter sp. G9-8]|uniref:Uncharacterized protein n=2 Tax=Octadecabacter dasysiphoniae TaxID=2909341 RepID=A0ABS9CRU6_9RHOB|nr:hypothetical protein [Octadecabacter dasysiphoniae]
MPNKFARMGQHLEGTQTILAAGHLVLALASAALIGQGAIVAWVALMSGGVIVYYLLNAWVVVLWL